MTFKDSIITCIQFKYADFSGRASRSEFWFFWLFNVLAQILLGIVGSLVNFPLLPTIFALAVLIPNLAVGARRLHDINWSGWWQLVILTGIGIIMMIVLWIMKGDEGGNKYGTPENQS